MSLLLFVLPLIYVDSIRDFSSLPRYALYGTSSGILFSLILIKKLTEGSLTQLPRLFIAIIAFLVWAWLSLIWSIDPKNAYIELIQLTGCIILGYSITQINSDKILIWLMVSSVAGASLAALIGIAQYFNYNPFDYLQFLVPASTFTNPNFFTIYLDLITPVAFSLIFIANKNRYKFLAVTSSVLCLSFLLISHNRGSWLALIFVLMGLLFLLYKNPNFKNTFIPLVKQHRLHLLISILVPFLLFFTSTNIVNKEVPQQTVRKTSSVSLTIDSSAKIRLHAYINSLSMIADRPIKGSGYGSFQNEFRNYMFSRVPFLGATEDKALARLHSDLLQSFVELGIIGGLLFIYIYIIILQACWNIIRTTTSPQLLLITSGIFLAIIANAIHACVDFPFHKPTSALQFWIWFGIITAIAAKTIPTKSIVINKLTLALFIISGFAFSAYNFKFYQNYIHASQLRLIAQKNMNKKDCLAAKQNVDKMMDLFDADSHHQSLYVSVYSGCEINNAEKLAAMNRVLINNKTNTRAYLTRATIYLQQKSTQKAINDFLQVTRILPHRASGYIGLAYASLQNKNTDAAIKLLKHAAKVEPGNKISLNLLNKITTSHP